MRLPPSYPGMAAVPPEGRTVPREPAMSIDRKGKNSIME